MNIVNYLKQLGSTLIRLRINPFLTHVEDFAIQLKSHVQHIRRGIELQNEHTQHKLAILSILEKEIESRKRSISYNWWLSINERLSLVTDPLSNEMVLNSFKENNYQLSSHAQHVLQLFPDVIALPTIHPQGTFSLNRFAFQGIAPVTLTNNTTIADGREYSSYKFWRHELIHISTGYGRKSKQKEVSVFHDFFIDTVEELELKTRTKVETAYFLLTHENSNNENTQLSDFTNLATVKSRITRDGEFMWRLSNSRDLGSLLPASNQNNISFQQYKSRFIQAQKEAENMANLFSETVAEAMKKYNETVN